MKPGLQNSRNFNALSLLSQREPAPAYHGVCVSSGQPLPFLCLISLICKVGVLMVPACVAVERMKWAISMLQPRGWKISKTRVDCRRSLLPALAGHLGGAQGAAGASAVGGQHLVPSPPLVPWAGSPSSLTPGSRIPGLPRGGDQETPGPSFVSLSEARRRVGWGGGQSDSWWWLSLPKIFSLL